MIHTSCDNCCFIKSCELEKYTIKNIAYRNGYCHEKRSDKWLAQHKEYLKDRRKENTEISLIIESSDDKVDDIINFIDRYKNYLTSVAIVHFDMSKEIFDKYTAYLKTINKKWFIRKILDKYVLFNDIYMNDLVEDLGTWVILVKDIGTDIFKIIEYIYQQNNIVLITMANNYAFPKFAFIQANGNDAELWKDKMLQQVNWESVTKNL